MGHSIILACQLLLGCCFYLGYGEEKESFITRVISGSPQSPYQLSWTVDLSYTLGGGMIFLLGQEVIPSNAKVFTEEEVQPGKFTKDDINVLDRVAVGPVNQLTNNISHQMNKLISFAPLLILAGEAPRKDAAKVLLMYGELYVVYRLTTILINPWVARKRPFFYSDEEPTVNKLNLEAQSSFVSGHTNFAFCYSVLTATLFSDYYPESKWKIPIWITAVTGATTVAILRCAAHKHFPTDVIAGAITGSLIGYSIPFFHRKPLSKRVQIQPFLGEYIGIQARISMAVF